jgi:hypothetical protein
LAVLLFVCAAPAHAMVSVTQDQPVQTSAQLLFAETPGAYQYVLLSAMWYSTLMMHSNPYVLWLAYNNFDHLGTSGEYWTAKAAYTRLVAAWGFGLVLLEQYWNADDFGSVLHEGVAPYLYYTYGNFILAGYLALAYNFSDEPQVSDEVSYAVGGGVSYKWQVGEKWTITPGVNIQYYDSGQDGWEKSLSILTGAKIRFKITEDWTLGAHVDLVTETESIQDDAWWDAGLKISHRFTDNARGFASVGTTEGADNFDATTVRVGLSLNF